MALTKQVLISFSLCFLISLHSCVGDRQQQQQSQQNVCDIQKLQAQEPRINIEAEAGKTEYWDWNDQQLQCAGVAACRTTIQSKGLLLPQYTNAPSLVYVVQGRGMTGVLMSGCPETYQSSQQSQEQQEEQRGECGERGEHSERGEERGERGERGEKRGERQSFLDQHQQIRHFQQGDIIALPAGVAHWCYNDGQEDVVLVVVEHTSSNQNKLDNNPRKFLLGGNPQGKQQQGQQQQQNFGNVFRGLTTEILTRVFQISEEIARKLQGRDDNRGHIVRVEGELQVIRPPKSIEQEQQQGGRGSQWNILNGEETICSSRLVQNINDPSRADVFNPRAGRLTTVNKYNLPILNYLRLSAQRGILYKNAIKLPNWKQNANTLVYVTRGEGQMQIVNQRGEAVFNDRVQKGQLLLIPQNFVVVTQAGNQGFEWTSFMTNENVMEQTIAGRTSAINAMPVDVLANTYKISLQQAHELKNNVKESQLFEPSQRSRSAFFLV